MILPLPKCGIGWRGTVLSAVCALCVRCVCVCATPMPPPWPAVGGAERGGDAVCRWVGPAKHAGALCAAAAAKFLPPPAGRLCPNHSLPCRSLPCSPVCGRAAPAVHPGLPVRRAVQASAARKRSQLGPAWLAALARLGSPQARPALVAPCLPMSQACRSAHAACWLQPLAHRMPTPCPPHVAAAPPPSSSPWIDRWEGGCLAASSL